MYALLLVVQSREGERKREIEWKDVVGRGW